LVRKHKIQSPAGGGPIISIKAGVVILLQC
jgi:hypothetical protein